MLNLFISKTLWNWRLKTLSNQVVKPCSGETNKTKFSYQEKKRVVVAWNLGETSQRSFQPTIGTFRSRLCSNKTGYFKLNERLSAVSWSQYSSVFKPVSVATSPHSSPARQKFRIRYGPLRLIQTHSVHFGVAGRVQQCKAVWWTGCYTHSSILE